MLTPDKAACLLNRAADLALRGRQVMLELAATGDEAAGAAAALERKGTTVGDGLQAVEHLRRQGQRALDLANEANRLGAELHTIADELEPGSAGRWAPTLEQAVAALQTTRS